jgi:hypothetical protein
VMRRRRRTTSRQSLENPTNRAKNLTDGLLFYALSGIGLRGP